MTLERTPVRNPKSVFAVDHLYSRWKNDGTRDISHEFSFKLDHEDEVTKEIDGVLRALHFDQAISHESRLYFVNLVIRLLLRSPKFLGLFRGSWRLSLIKLLIKASVYLSKKRREAAKRSGLSLNDMVEAEMRAMISTANIEKYLELIRSSFTVSFRDPAVGCPSFILGDQPVLIQRRRWSQNEMGEVQSEVGRYEFHAIVDPRLMISLYPVEVFDEESFVEVDRSFVQSVNGLIIKYCDEVVVRNILDLDGAWYRLFPGEDWIRQRKKLSRNINYVEITVSSEGG